MAADLKKRGAFWRDVSVPLAIFALLSYTHSIHVKSGWATLSAIAAVFCAVRGFWLRFKHGWNAWRG